MPTLADPARGGLEGTGHGHPLRAVRADRPAAVQTSHGHTAAAAATATAVPMSRGCRGSSAHTAQANVGISPAGGPVRTASETSLVSPATRATTSDDAMTESLRAATEVPAATARTSVTAVTPSSLAFNRYGSLRA